MPSGPLQDRFLPMKVLRLFLLLGVSAMLLALAWDYTASRHASEVRLADIPETLPVELNSKSGRWQWSQSSGESNRIEVSAGSFREVRDSMVFDLLDVELKIHHLNDSKFDQISTSKALFQAGTGQLTSDAPVVMRLGLSAAGEAPGGKRPTIIRGSGVTFDSKAGISSTGRHTEYEFDGGSGESTGAYYDSQHRMFKMLADVRLTGRPSGPDEPPPTIQADELVYFEDAQRIDLHGNVVLERGRQRVHADDAFVFLQDGALARIEATHAAGLDSQSGRQVEFRADRLEVHYGAGNAVERIAGNGGARLQSTSAKSSTDVTADWIDLRYAMAPGTTDSLLDEADARGAARLEWWATAAPPAGTRRLTSEWIHLKMRLGGGEVEKLSTMQPGKLELASDKHGAGRVLTAKMIEADYAAGNAIRQLHASGNVDVQTLPPTGVVPPPKSAALHTTSDRLLAEFKPQSGELDWLKQWDGFEFTQGERSGSGNEATYWPEGERIEIRGDAAVEEPSGRIQAARILLEQAREAMTAEGSVTSSFQESKRPSGGGAAARPGIFQVGRPVYASADRLVRNAGAAQISYSGRARMWQGENRIEAERIDIFQHDRILEAKGHVVTFLNSRAAGQDGAGRAMRVSAESLRYDDRASRVYYREKSELQNNDLTVSADTIEAILQPSAEGGSNGLEWALARGAVEIKELGPKGGRRGAGAEAEYWPNEERIVLSGEPARLANPSGDETRGRRLTYSVDGDRLLVRGNTAERAFSARRKP